MKNRLCLLIFALMAVVSCAFAQRVDENAIKWRMSVKMTSPTEGTVTLRAIIADGWHLYGTEIPKNGPVPTTFDFSSSKGVKFLGAFQPSATPISKTDKNFGMALNWWDKDVSFVRKFKLTGKIDEAEISGSVKFMGCNDANCLPPKTQSFKTTPKAYQPK